MPTAAKPRKISVATTMPITFSLLNQVWLFQPTVWNMLQKPWPYSHEPDEVQCQHPPSSESKIEKFVRVALLGAGEHRKLHLGPEVGKMECKDAENDDAKHEHILC